MKTCNRTILIIQLCCFVGLLSAQTNLGLNLDNHLSTLTRTKAEKTEAKISKFIQRLDNDEQLENPIILQHEAKEKYFYMERSEAIQVPGTEVFVSESFVETDDKVIIVRLDETEYMVRYIDQEFEYDYYGSHKEGFQFRKLKIEPEEDFVCGHDHGDVEVENQIKKKLTQRRPTCGTNEYILELGVALDFEYIDNIHGGNTAAAVTRVVTDFFGVRAKYGECTMRIFVQLIDMVIEPCDNCLFIAPWCGNNNSDAYLYNQLFNSSPFKPAGDVISLVTGRNLRGVACVNDIGGMSYGFGGVCNDNWTSQRSNIYEGRTFSRVGLWVHEIGHTLGYGSFHQ